MFRKALFSSNVKVKTWNYEAQLRMARNRSVILCKCHAAHVTNIMCLSTSCLAFHFLSKTIKTVYFWKANIVSFTPVISTSKQNKPTFFQDIWRKSKKINVSLYLCNSVYNATARSRYRIAASATQVVEKVQDFEIKRMLLKTPTFVPLRLSTANTVLRWSS